MFESLFHLLTEMLLEKVIVLLVIFLIGLITVFDAILTSRQTGLK